MAGSPVRPANLTDGGMIPYGLADAHTFARALIEYGQGLAPRLPTARFRLPCFELTVATDSGVYLALCQRALVDDPASAQRRALHVAVLDYATHPQMPRGIWSGVLYGRGVLRDGLKPAGFEGAFDPDRKSMQFLDPAGGAGIELMVRPGDYPPWNESFPLRNFLHWAYQSIGWRIVHAATLGIDGKGVLLAGPGGAGKSGTTLAGVLAGLDSVGDDYVAMQASDTTISAHPVMRLMKQDAAGLARLRLDPARLGLGDLNWQDKYEFDFEVLGAGRRARAIDIKAIVLPRVRHAERSTLSRARAADVMNALAPNNLQQLPDGWAQGLSFIGALARRLPAWWLDLGDDPAEIADVIGELIGRGGA